MFGPSRTRNAVTLALCGWLASCVTGGAQERAAPEETPSVLREAALQVTRSPLQWAPLAALAVAYPIAENNDTQWSASIVRDPLVGEPKKNGDLLLETMMGTTAAWSLTEWYLGDEGKATEALLESAVLTSLIVESLKSLRSRPRPAGSNSTKSFPSGHAATAFVTATFIARRVDDMYEGSSGYLGYLSYLPAAAVALNRVENARHYPSDVVAGMLIGTVLTNFIYNAHYGSDERSGILPVGVRVGPQISEDFVGLGMEFRF